MLTRIMLVLGVQAALFDASPLFAQLSEAARRR
jgi:hypothetical protein